MAALSDIERRFVRCIFKFWDTPAEAVKAAGYSCARPREYEDMGFGLRMDPRIQAAIEEELPKQAKALLPNVLGQWAATLVDPLAKRSERNAAGQAIANRAGFSEKTEHKITVEHSLDSKDMEQRIAAKLQAHGVDPRKLLGHNTVIDITPEPKPDGYDPDEEF
jgi:hypothetical protein